MPFVNFLQPCCWEALCFLVFPGTPGKALLQRTINQACSSPVTSTACAHSVVLSPLMGAKSWSQVHAALALKETSSFRVHAAYQDELAQPQRARDIGPIDGCGATGNYFLCA